MAFTKGPEQKQQNLQPWSFNQPVLLNKTRRNSSVLVWTLVGATTFAGIWAFMAPLPETVAVQGKLQPTQSVQDIEASMGGVVKQVLVKEGQQVQQGQLLVQFDSRDANARLKAAKAKRAGLNNQLIINRALVGELLPAELSTNQQQLLDSRRKEFAQSDEANANALASSRARAEGLRRNLIAAETIAERFDALNTIGAISELRSLEARTRRDTLRSDLNSELRNQARLESIAVAESARRLAQRRREIEDIERNIADLDREIQQANVLLSEMNLTAPIAGLVFDLNVSPGNVVQPSNEAKPLLKLIPQGTLQAKVYIPNSAIGFVKPGQRADISLNSFNAGDYGYLPATVLRVGSDALTPDEQRSVLGTEVQGLFFPATLTLKQQSLSVGERSISLQPGMSLTADLHLRTRRFIGSITDLLEDKRRSLERMR